MQYELAFDPTAEAEALEELNYYDSVSSELGDRFHTELLETYNKLHTSPQHYSFVHGIKESTIRDVKIPSFPYVVVFKILDTRVFVLSVKLTHRKPE